MSWLKDANSKYGLRVWRSVYLFNTFFNQVHYVASRYVLGIESTFDDTGAALVDQNGNILAEAIIKQKEYHIKNRGVNPTVAQLLHRKHLPLVVEETMKKAKKTFKDVEALATATQPGLSLCLGEGLEFSKQLIKEHKVPFLPVHHMEAHLLTVRLFNPVEFPFLCLLVSGGHCVLCIAHKLGDYQILGHTLDEPPGAVLDKVSRSFKHAKYGEENMLLGGKDLEELAKVGDRFKHRLIVPFSGQHKRSCDFSFCGIQTQAISRINTAASIEDEADIAAWLQFTLFRHIATNTHRAILFCKEKGLLPETNATLVLSGGVGSNATLRRSLNVVCEITGTKLVAPPTKLCTDNGVMIAWAGMEYLKEGRGISQNPLDEKYKPKSPLGSHIGAEVERLHIKLPKIDYFTFHQDCV